MKIVRIVTILLISLFVLNFSQADVWAQSDPTECDGFSEDFTAFNDCLDALADLEDEALGESTPDPIPEPVPADVGESDPTLVEEPTSPQEATYGPDPVVDTIEVKITDDFDAQFSSIIANGLIFGNICSEPTAPCKCRDTGICTIIEGLQVFVNISVFILGMIGSLVLLMFVYGGYLWVMSRGDSKRIENGKQTMVNAIVGMFLIFTAYAMINLTIAWIAGDTPQPNITETINDSDDAIRSLQ